MLLVVEVEVEVGVEVPALVLEGVLLVAVEGVDVAFAAAPALA